MILFFDTSAIMKRYFREKGSETVKELLHESSGVFVSIICLLEVRSVLQRLVEMKEIKRAEATMIYSQFERDSESFSIIPLNDIVLRNARHAIDTLRLRTLDSIQFGSYIYVEEEAECFVTSDDKLIAACRKQKIAYRGV